MMKMKSFIIEPTVMPNSRGTTEMHTFFNQAPSRARYIVAVLAALAPFSAPVVAGAQRPALRPLGQAVATSAPLGSVSAIRALSNGTVLVNDPINRQVLLLDSTMKVIRVVADTTAKTQHAYGTVDGGLVPYRGDSTLFVDPASYSMLVIGPAGDVIRVIAAPRPSEVSALLGAPRGGNAGFDANGFLVYRNNVNFSFRGFRGRDQTDPAGEAAPPPPPQAADTAAIVRFNLGTRKEDTAAFTHVATTKLVWVKIDGNERIAPEINPIQVVDDWAIRPDGVIAILRKNYHVDFVANNGAKSSGALIPFPWERLNDSAKVAIIDSVKAARTAAFAPRTDSAAKRDTAARDSTGRDRIVPGFGGGAGGGGFAGAGGFGGRGGRGGFGGGRLPPQNGTSAAATALRNAALMIRFVDPKELPDYKPAFASGALHSDADGKLWVRIITRDTSSKTGPAYDVIDKTGKLIDCVETPNGTTIAGFGPDGAVYLGVRDKAGVHLVRAREK